MCIQPTNKPSIHSSIHCACACLFAASLCLSVFPSLLHFFFLFCLSVCLFVHLFPSLSLYRHDTVRKPETKTIKIHTHTHKNIYNIREIMVAGPKNSFREVHRVKHKFYLYILSTICLGPFCISKDLGYSDLLGCFILNMDHYGCFEATKSRLVQKGAKIHCVEPWPP